MGADGAPESRCLRCYYSLFPPLLDCGLNHFFLLGWVEQPKPDRRRLDASRSIRSAYHGVTAKLQHFRPRRDRAAAARCGSSAQRAGTTAEDKPARFGDQIARGDGTASTPAERCATLPFSRILTAVLVLVTIVVAVFPVTIVMVMFTIFVPFSFFTAVPLTIVPMITVMLVPFAIVSARYSNGELLR
jgi:hypothetical protein